jgi:hypothetical protein
MTQRIVRIAPMQAGKVFALWYGIFGLVFVPFFLIPVFAGAKNAPPMWLPILFVPFYAVAGFVMTALMAWLYNLVTRWVGGLEITLEIGSEHGTPT